MCHTQTPPTVVPFNSDSDAASSDPTPNLDETCTDKSVTLAAGATFCFDETEYDELIDRAFWED
jgi:hypothetical protein